MKKKFYISLFLFVISNNLLANQSNWKYVKPDPGYHSGYAYVGNKFIYVNDGFSYTSNVGCNYMTLIKVDGQNIEFNCNKNKWGNWVLQFPAISNDLLVEKFTKQNFVNFLFLFIDGSDDLTEFSAKGFIKAKSLVTSSQPQKLTIDEQKIEAVKEAKIVCAEYKQYPASYHGCLRVYILNNYSHLN